LVIYDKWGRLVFDATGYKQNFAAENLPLGVYYYNLTVGLQNKQYIGWVNILK
jgi:hypothetical protein